MTALRGSSEQFHVAERAALYPQRSSAVAIWSRGDGLAAGLPRTAPGGEPSALDG